MARIRGAFLGGAGASTVLLAQTRMLTAGSGAQSKARGFGSRRASSWAAPGPGGIARGRSPAPKGRGLALPLGRWRIRPGARLRPLRFRGGASLRPWRLEGTLHAARIQRR